MSIKPVSARQKINQRIRYAQAPFRLHPIASVIAGMALMASGSLHAAEPTVVELQAEIARLKQIIATQGGAADSLQEKVADGGKTDPAADAGAQPEDAKALGAVTVRGRKRAALETLKDVPTSVSVVTGSELARLGATDISAITQRAANVVYNPGNQRTNSLSIRGVGKIGQLEAQDPSVGITVDGVSYAFNPLVSSYDFADVDKVEVLRGPQGTLGGKNTNLGVINIATNRPSFTPSADYSITLGQRDTVQGRLAAGGPIVDDLLAWRGSFTANKGLGPMTNISNNDQTFSNTDRVAGKVQFLLTPTRDFSARFAFDAQPNSNENTNNAVINTPTPTVYSNGSINNLATDASTRLNRGWFTREAGYSYNNTYLYGAGGNSVDLNAGYPLATSTHGASAELNWDLGSHTLTSITAFRNYHFNAVNDEGTPFDIGPNNGGVWDDYKQLSQELRLSSQVGGFVDYQTGLYLLKDSDNNHDQKSWGSDAGAFYASTAQYNRLYATTAGQMLMQNSLNRVNMYYNSPSGTSDIRNTSAAAYGQANWHFTDKLTLTTGVRITHEDRENTGSSSVLDNGFGASLNPVAVGGVQLGGFASNGAGILAANNSAAQLSLADSVANQYFGTKISGTPGTAYKSLTAAQQQQVADAKNIRAANIGVLFNTAAAQSYTGNLPTFNFSPSYKINDNLTTYLSWQHGEKAGIAQFTNGVSNPVKAEKTNAFELGFKSALLDKTLILNADLFLMNITNYQQAVRVLDAYTTALNNDGSSYYTTATGNVPKVQAKGVEFDGVFSGIKNTTIRFSGAYNDAVYKSFPNSAQPVENGYTGAAPYQDVSGQALPGAAKLTFNVGADYRQPILSGQVFHTSFNTTFTSRYNSDPSLSQYAWIHANSTTDFAVGIGSHNESYDLTLLVKNLFGNKTPLLQTWNSYTPQNPRWFGVMWSGKL
jgi:iron complex outermembrane recepter protein